MPSSYFLLASTLLAFLSSFSWGCCTTTFLEPLKRPELLRERPYTDSLRGVTRKLMIMGNKLSSPVRQAHPTSGAGIIPPRSSLSILTYNVWFDDYYWEKRQRAIFDITSRLLPDVVCFQEALPRFVSALTKEPWSRNYLTSDPRGDGATVQPYGVVMMVKKELQPSFRFVDLPTYMYRRLLIASLGEGLSCPFQVATVHLESLNSPDLRRQQLDVARQELAATNAVLCGDFNFCSYRNFHGHGKLEHNLCLQELIPDYRDLWPALHPETTKEPVFTFDSTINRLITHHEQMRYDRIMAKLDPSSSWRPSTITLIGDTPLNDQHLFPSDHFGPLGILTSQPSPQPRP